MTTTHLDQRDERGAGDRHAVPAQTGGARTGAVRTRGVRGLGAAVLVTVLALGGCAAAPELSDDDAAAFRERVSAIADRSLAGDFAGATAELGLLESAVAEASAAGTLADPRETQITDAIALVRADLDAQVRAQQEAAAAAAAAEAAAQEAAAAEAARVAAEQATAAEDDGDNGNSGPGKDKPGKDKPGKGNSNGNGNGNGNGGDDEDDE